MASRLKETFIKYNVAYGLSGERREAAVRQYKLWLMLVALVTIAIFVIANGGYSTINWMIVYGGLLLASAVLAFLAFRWRETRPQLWMHERKALKQQKADNLREIERFKETMVQQEDQDGSRSNKH